MDHIRLYTGFDSREAVGWHVFAQSVIENSSLPVEIIPLTETLGKSLGIATDGTNAFSKIRFAIPYLCGFKGFAIFADGADMLMRDDLAELWNQRQSWYGVQVVKHEYKTKHPRKYLGTELEAENQDYPRKNWSSLVVWNNSFCAHQELTPEFIAKQPGSYLHRFSWLKDDRIGDLDPRWNWLVGEQPMDAEAKIAHFTLGLPAWTAYAEMDYGGEWRNHLRKAQRGL